MEGLRQERTFLLGSGFIRWSGGKSFEDSLSVGLAFLIGLTELVGSIKECLRWGKY